MSLQAQGYRPYTGAFLPPQAAAVRAIALAGLRRPWKGRFFKLFLGLAQIPAVVYAVILFAEAGLARTGGGLAAAAAAGGARGEMGPALKAGDDSMRLLLDAGFLLHSFLKLQLWTAALLVALLAGADTIAGDVRANAMPLYFSRPITRTHYLAGKLLPVLFYLSLVTLAPALLLLVARVSFMAGVEPAAGAPGGAAAVADLLGPALPLCAGAALVAVALSVLVLACSAAGGRNWVARAAFVLLWFLPLSLAAATRELTGGLPIAGYASLADTLAALLAALFGEATPLHPAGAAAGLAAWCAAGVGFLYWRLRRAAELR
ncbi:MAG TPA: hypothetical protein VG389_18835 [Myxococcota bacterium]|jgi:hypothetical protein|nr:hypothetical protein [Myxococcota bacterium]